jgi:hypothetical protein
MSFYQPSDNSAGVSGQDRQATDLRSPRAGIISNDLLEKNTIGRIDQALHVMSSSNVANGYPVDYEFRAGSAFFNLLISGKLSTNERINFYDNLKLIFSCPRSRVEFLSDFCRLQSQKLEVFALVLRALGNQDAILENHRNDRESRLENKLVLKLFSLSLGYATGHAACDKNYLNTFFETFPCMFTRTYYQCLNSNEFNLLKKIINSKFDNFTMYADEHNLNLIYDEDSQYMLGKLYGVCLDRINARHIALEIQMQINNPSRKNELNNFICSALEMYDSDMFADSFSRLNQVPNEIRKNTLLQNLKNNLKNDAILLGSGLLALYLIDSPNLFNNIPNSISLITSYAILKLIKGIAHYNSIAQDDKWINERQEKRFEYDQSFITQLCKSAIENPNALIDLLIYMERPALDDSRRIYIFKTIAKIDNYHFQHSFIGYMKNLSERIHSKKLDILNNFQPEVAGLLNACFVLREHYRESSLRFTPMRLKNAILLASEFLPNCFKSQIFEQVENM